MALVYVNLFSRLVANTELAIPDDETSCWLWTGRLNNDGYPVLALRVPGKPNPIKVYAHRAMLEEVHDVRFPHDEAGHLCYTPHCINPQHLEVQTQAHNLAERRGYAPPKHGKSWIPVLYPRNEHVERFIEMALEADQPTEPAGACPF